MGIKMGKFLNNVTPPFIQKLVLDSLNRPKRFNKLNAKFVSSFQMKFELVEFSFINIDFKYDLKWGWWSRVYEYELILQKLEQLKSNRNSLVHNTCWGYQGCHILFKDQLESKFVSVINSDILESQISNTIVHDLRNECPKEWENHFDFVINVSTLEEIRFPHIKVFENLLKMVKTNGYLIVTFDVPGLHLKSFEKLFNRRIDNVSSPISGKNSPYRMDQFEFLNTGYFIVRKM
jgi:hypothetical protein